MIVPAVKVLTSPDLARPAVPLDPEDCSVLCEAHIGDKGGQGAERFQFVVVTPRYLLREGGVTWGRGYLIVDEFSWAAVDRSLERLCLHAWRPSWTESAAELSKELHWEFENYAPEA